MGFRAIVLCAGVGERLRPLTYKTNKSLLEVAGGSVIEHLLYNLALAGVDVAHVVIGHYGYKFRRLLKSKMLDMKIQFLSNSLYNITGGAQSIYVASHILRKHQCLVVDGDHYFDPSLLPKLLGSEFENCVLVDRAGCKMVDCSLVYEEELAAYGQGGILTKLISSRPYPPDPLGETLGFFKFSKQASHSLAVILEHYLLEDGPAKKEYMKPFNMLMNLHDIHYLDTEGKKWIDIDFLEDYERAKEMTF